MLVVLDQQIAWVQKRQFRGQKPGTMLHKQGHFDQVWSQVHPADLVLAFAELREKLPGQVYEDLDGALQWVQLKSLAWLLRRGVYMVRPRVGVQASPTTNLQGSKGHLCKYRAEWATCNFLFLKFK